MNNKIKNNLGGISVILLCLTLVLDVLVLTGMAITFKKAIGLSVLLTAVLFGAAFGIYCLVEWIKEKKKQVDGE